MTIQQILALAYQYGQMLREKGVSPRRMDITKTLGELTSEERLQHACYLADNLPNLEFEKANRHLAALQMIMSFEKLFTLEQLMK